MPFPGDASEWRELWADLLRDVGTGLLEFDGSPAAHAALAGLQVFDTAQERRRQQSSDEPDKSADPQEVYKQIYSKLYLTPIERAHFARLSPEEQKSWLEEMAEVDRPLASPAEHFQAEGKDSELLPVHSGAPALNVPLPFRRPPISASPFEEWPLSAILPLGVDGQLQIPTFRR